MLLVYDSDDAGLSAAERSLDIFFEVELPARILFGESEIDGTDGKMRMLAARDVRHDEHHPADADPPRDVNARLRRAED